MKQFNLKKEDEMMSAYISNVKALMEAVNAVTKTVNVEINADDLIRLQDNNYRMCFAKKIGNENYNVIWQSYVDFSENNTFSWIPKYQVFRTDTFRGGVTVKVASNPKNIGIGELVTIDKHGIISDAKTGGDVTALNVDNEYKATHIGVSQLSIGIDGREISTPIYVSEDQCMIGKAKLQPVEKIMIWFEKNVETSTMLADIVTKGFEVDLTQKNSASIRYENEKWAVI